MLGTTAAGRVADLAAIRCNRNIGYTAHRESEHVEEKRTFTARSAEINSMDKAGIFIQNKKKNKGIGATAQKTTAT